ncbi:MAG TPA: glycosyltransferase family 2 protein [bacterium]|nr:glycosyltransferase family 2 protein [bacterium]HPN92958.1 glycosyltransferase family 2 protein [bacterium]
MNNALRKQDRAISCVIPAFNEEECVEAAITESLSALRNHCSRYEVIVVDDGSSDATADIVREISSRQPEVKLISHSANIGYGAALRTGFEASSMNLIFYTDCDLQFDAEEISLLLPLLEERDIVAGYRMHRADNLLRIIVSKCFNIIFRFVFGLRVRDVNCAFKIFKKEVFDSIIIESDNFFVDAEILAKAKACGMRIAEVGVTHFARRGGKATVKPSNVSSTLIQMIKIKISLRKLENHNR